MSELTINEIARVVDGKIVNTDKNIRFTDYHFDSRLLKDNSLFFAIKSEKDDGHRYLNQVAGLRGTGAVVSLRYDETGIDIPLIKVSDPLQAAQALAEYVRNKYHRLRYIGITGSAGKTTTKEFTYRILSSKFAVYRSFENWNNWIGLPFSMLKIKGSEGMALFELAMSNPGIGEIDRLARILKPDVSVILNVFPVHLEYLKSMENICKAKAEIMNYLESDDLALVNGDFRQLVKESVRRKGKLIFFGSKPGRNQIVLREVLRDGNHTRVVIDFNDRQATFSSEIVNAIHIENLFAAIVIAHCLGMSDDEIQSSVYSVIPLKGRGVIRREKGFWIIDESYNSNPEALKRVLDWVDREYLEDKIAVLGDMLELGEKENDFHRDVGRFFATLHFSRLITVGQRALNIAEGATESGFPEENITLCKNPEEAGTVLRQQNSNNIVILFKASRGIALERAIEVLLK